MQNRLFLAILLFVGIFSIACQPTVEPENAPATPEALPAEPESDSDGAPDSTAEEETVEVAEPTDPAPAPTEESKFPATSTPIPADGESEKETNMSETNVHPNVTKAIEDLTGRMAVTADSVKVMSVEDKTWSDSSLGCPQEGFMYSQALVEGGMLIQLKMDGTVYNYHAGPDGDPFLCENK